MTPNTTAATVRRTLADWGRSRRLRLVGVAAAAYLVGALVVDRAALAVGLSLAAGEGFVLALGVAFGPGAAVGAGVGRVLFDVVTGSFGLRSAVGYAAAFVLVFATVAFWNGLGRYGRFERGAMRFVAASVPAMLAAAAVGAWGAETLARAPFATAFLAAVGDGVGALAVGLVALPAAGWLAGRGVPVLARDSDAGPALSGLAAAAAAVVALLWGTLGTLLSIAFQPLQLEPSQTLANRFGWTAATLVDVAGPAGRHLQLLLGLAAIALLGVLFGKADNL